MKKIFFSILCLSGIMMSFADIRLPSVVSSNMVLQQQSAVKLWGWSAPAEKIYITTSWNNKTDSVVGTRDANWQITIQTPTAGGPYSITFKGNNQIVLDNVLIGEVWACSGQSNMEMNGQWGLKDIKEDLPTSYNKNIRFFYIPKTTSDYPQDDCKGAWEICDSNTVKTFSAAGYFFGKKLNKDLNVPIGLINSNWGGTAAEVWTPADVVYHNDSLKMAAAKLTPALWWPYKPGVAFNAMISPITNYSIAGAIWYQGESNTGTASTYSALFTSMIDAWRKKWDKEFPFYYVQIAPFNYGNKNIGALLQEAQTKSMQHQQVGMVVISDLVDDLNNIHPQDKHDVGYRLANWALAETYHKEGIAYKSPVFKTMDVQKGKAIISFENVKSGLQSKSGTVTELYIAGSDKIFYPAKAKIDHDQLIVWSKAVPQPAAVRYAFGNTAIGNLFSKEGLPVTAFRTDNWDVDTSQISKLEK
ncbi:MAG: sialate O-acetylesterase [Chitinophagales bacterium]